MGNLLALLWRAESSQTSQTDGSRHRTATSHQSSDTFTDNKNRPLSVSLVIFLIQAVQTEEQLSYVFQSQILQINRCESKESEFAILLCPKEPFICHLLFMVYLNGSPVHGLILVVLPYVFWVKSETFCSVFWTVGKKKSVYTKMIWVYKKAII